jgi:hypothetical protein
LLLLLQLLLLLLLLPMLNRCVLTATWTWQ